MRVVTATWIALQLGIVTAIAGQSPTGPVLRGRVLDARTASPLRDVGVTITAGSDTVARGQTDSLGAFQVTAKAGPLVAHFVRIGFRRDSIATTVGEFPLRVAMVTATAASTVASALQPVVVRDTVARTAFERRARRGTGGSFIRAEDITRRKPTRLSDLFRSSTGLRVYDSSGVTQLVSTRGARSMPDAGLGAPGDSVRPPTNAVRGCVIRVGLDGRLMPTEFSVDEMRPEDIAGIEIYLGAATMPAEFSGVERDAPCGLVMLWTKLGARR